MLTLWATSVTIMKSPQNYPILESIQAFARTAQICYYVDALGHAGYLIKLPNLSRSDSNNCPKWGKQWGTNDSFTYYAAHILFCGVDMTPPASVLFCQKISRKVVPSPPTSTTSKCGSNCVCFSNSFVGFLQGPVRWNFLKKKWEQMLVWAKIRHFSKKMAKELTNMLLVNRVTILVAQFWPKVIQRQPVTLKVAQFLTKSTNDSQK